jgi:hypothetical protein
MELPSIKEYHLENYTVIGDRLCIRFNNGEDVGWAGRIIVGTRKQNRIAKIVSMTYLLSCSKM